jgi:hypothetical protein
MTPQLRNVVRHASTAIYAGGVPRSRRQSFAVPERNADSKAGAEQVQRDSSEPSQNVENHEVSDALESSPERLPGASPSATRFRAPSDDRKVSSRLRCENVASLQKQVEMRSYLEI